MQNLRHSGRPLSQSLHFVKIPSYLLYTTLIFKYSNASPSTGCCEECNNLWGKLSLQERFLRNSGSCFLGSNPTLHGNFSGRQKPQAQVGCLEGHARAVWTAVYWSILYLGRFSFLEVRQKKACLVSSGTYFCK